MAVASPSKTIDDLTAKAAKALKEGRCFEAEGTALEAMALARRENEFARMAAIVPVVQDAQTLRWNEAFDAGTVTVLDDPSLEEIDLAPGCYLVQPPLVGADARRLRQAAFNRGVSAVIVCREPLSILGLCPLVAISPGVTVRTKTDPPPDPEGPDLDWIGDAIEALGDAALESVDPAIDVEKRIDALLARMEAVPLHAGLLEELERTCLEAHEAAGTGEGA